MKSKFWAIILVLALAVLAACSDDSDESEELKMLDVHFELPETADVDETIEVKATVTFGGEEVTDADQMEFEYWKENNRDDSTFIDGENNGDGTYTAEVSFDQDGIYELYAHTTARDLHTMPKREITIGHDEEESR